MQTYPPDHPYLDLIDPAPNKADCGKFPARGFARLICSGKPGVPLAYIVLSGRERGWGSASSAPHRNGRYAAERTTRHLNPRRIDDDRRYDHMVLMPLTPRVGRGEPAHSSNSTGGRGRISATRSRATQPAARPTAGSRRRSAPGPRAAPVREGSGRRERPPATTNGAEIDTMVPRAQALELSILQVPTA
jgi:hypothetical protein